VRHPVVLTARLSSILAAWCGCALALDPSLDVSQYAHTSWKVRDGFAKGQIMAITKTRDGYIWLGTEFGLLRFDGARPVPWRAPGAEQLPSDVITDLLSAHDGTLWIGTLSGLASYQDDKITRYREVVDAPIGSLFEDREQTVWFGVFGPKGRLCLIRDGKIECDGERIFAKYAATALYQDHKGNLWASSDRGLWRWAPRSPERYVFRSSVTQVPALVEGESGVLLLATNDGLKQLVTGKIENHPLPGISGKFRPIKFLRTSDGSLWIGTQGRFVGLLNKQVGGELGISEVTVKAHRGRVMQKKR